MADADYDDYYDYAGYDAYGSGPAEGGRWQRLVNGAGALTSLALIAGIGVWGYKLAVRDVNGIPVIRALEGPARIAPDNPGGELALHQGMAVNRIAAEGTAAAPADRLTLAPAPTGLSEEDTAMGKLAGAEAPGASDTPRIVQPPEGGERLQPAAMRPAEPLPDGPVDPVDGEDAAATDAAPFVAPDVIPASVPGLARSLKPLARPGGPAAAPLAGAAEESDAGVDAMAEAAAAAVAAALAPDTALDVDPATLAAGTRLVQIGAYPTRDEAQQEWERAAVRFGPLMQGKRRVIETSDSAGQTLYRLRVEGFTDAEDAKVFCAALTAENAVCVPATVK